ncbi:hypothetical protein BGZ51_000541 [Haplosporangium sp. Z 767]|nr:hypothetical protein BGZ51_000541 [Haplosporangium sp. Z 767]KAF9195696.1 hypothetical protein BGZ50_003866 [Haplosporangium sp. Z 11]
MDMETVSQFLLGNHPTWDFLKVNPVGARILLTHQDKPWILLHLILLPVLLVSLFHYFVASPVVLTYGKNNASIKVFDKETGKTKSENLVDYIKRKCPSLSNPARGALFHPTLWMTSGHLQTAYAAYVNFENTYHISYQRELLSTPDGGTVSIDWAPSMAEKPIDDTPTLVLLHGLTGGSFESYIRALVDTMTKDHGYRCVVFNARACANTELTSAQLYCGSWTEDLRMVVKHIRKTLPEAKLMSIGFSLGSNILMNYMGEEGDQCEFMGAVSVGNPFDLMGACLSLERRFLGKNVYSPAMGGNLKRIFMRHSKWFENSDVVDVEEVKRGTSMRDFDDRVTRKVFKYRTVHEYYRMASCCQRILDIKRPFLCLNALDDPISVSELLPRDEISENPFGLLATTARGGHLGWFQGLFSQDRWCTKPLAEYIIAMFEADPRSITETPSSKHEIESHIVRDHNALDHKGQNGATTKPERHQ